jgi:hypothetical protein
MLSYICDRSWIKPAVCVRGMDLCESTATCGKSRSPKMKLLEDADKYEMAT